MRFAALAASLVGTLIFGLLIPYNVVFIALFSVCATLSAIGVWDLLQSRHSIRRNYPILANIRFMLEKIRPEIRQYFLESETDGTPFNRSKRAIAYQRAKGALDKRPFGTQQDIYGNNFEWINHSIVPCHVDGHDFRVAVGGADCRRPYALSLFNISAMSFGALSANAIRALNRGAKAGGFAHDTGEGGISRYHREFGGDLIWEIGSGYFGCRNDDGSFCADRFAAEAQEPQIKMVEIKLSQGAKPGHGGVLPGAKVTAEIAHARGVPIGVDCISPARHAAFKTPTEMMRFIARLRELCGGKPVGFKLCVGHPWEFMALCKAMLETGTCPDFIVIDGTEGGTGAAPLEFVDHVGTPLREGLVLAHNCLVGAGLRQSIRLGASGRVVTGFDIARLLALGADWCNAAVALCSRWAAFRRNPVIPTVAQPACPPRIYGASGRSSSTTRRPGCANFTKARSPPWASWWAPPGWRTRASFGPSIFSSEFRRAKSKASPKSTRSSSIANCCRAATIRIIPSTGHSQTQSVSRPCRKCDLPRSCRKRADTPRRSMHSYACQIPVAV
jgi:glutamate synthase domain-containing protein 2